MAPCFVLLSFTIPNIFYLKLVQELVRMFLVPFHELCVIWLSMFLVLFRELCVIWVFIFLVLFRELCVIWLSMFLVLFLEKYVNFIWVIFEYRFYTSHQV